MTEMMRAAVITDEKKIEIKDVRKPVAGKGEILVNIKACAICTWEQRTFLRIAKMPLPFIGGHEIAGVIESLGEEVNEKDYIIGQKVAIRSFNSCGRCYHCRSGRENLCENIHSISRDPHKEIAGPGGLGQFLVVTPNEIFKLPESLPFEYGALTEPLACVVNSIEQGQVELGNDVVVIGAGIMGLLHVMVSKLRGARVIVSEPDPIRRKKAEEAGADVTFNPIEEDFVQKVKNLTEGRGADVIFNTTAIAKIAEQAVLGLGRSGRVVMYSSIHPANPISVSPDWIHSTQVSITGAVSPSVKSFQTSSVLLSKGLIVPDKLISAKYDIEEGQLAFEEAIKPDTYRIIVTNY